MSLTSLIRRGVAVTTAAALMTGGLALAASPAQALIPAAEVTKIAPSSWDNRSEVGLTVSGSGFVPGDVLELQPACSQDPTALPAGTPCVPLTGPEVGTLKFSGGSVNPQTGSLTVDADLAMAPPGWYRVVVRHAAPDNTPSSPFSYFRVFAYGSANALSTVAGVGVSGVDNQGVDCTLEISNTGCGRSGALPLDVRGSNFAIGAKVEFLTEPGLAVDAGLPFTPGNPSNATNSQNTSDDTGYPTTTVIQGSYDTVLNAGEPTFTPGWHRVRVTNTDGAAAGSTTRFAQPYFASEGSVSLPSSPTDASPTVTTTIGQGAKNQLLRITGQGIRPGSTVFVERKSTSTCADVSVGTPSYSPLGADGLHTWVQAPVTFADCSNPNNTARRLGIVGPDGGRFFRNAFLSIGGFPTVTKFELAEFATLGQGAREGFDGAPTDGVALFGAGFVGFNQTDVAEMTKFDFGPGTTTTTRYVNELGTVAFVSIAIDPAAGTGERTVRATNPDGGSAVSDCERLDTGDCDPLGDGPILTITTGPKVTKVEITGDSPAASMSPGQADPTKYRVTGSGFQASGYAGSQFVVALPGQTTQDPNVQLAAINRVSATEITFLASALSNAVAGPRDLIVENDDHGRVVCAACLGIDSVSVSPSTAPNTGVTSPAIGLTVLVDGLPPLTSGSTATLSHQAPLPGQPDITATTVAATDGKHGSAVFNLANAALGRYNVTVVLDPAGTQKTVSCIGCFTVTGAPMALDAQAPVTPNKGAQGVRDWKLTFKGTGFTRGTTVSILDVTVHDVTFVSSTEITALVDIADNAPLGSKSGTLTSGDGTTQSFTFTVTEKPSITASTATPAAYGAGAGSAGSPTPAPTFSVDGNGFSSSPASQVVLGAGVEATGEAVTQGTPPTGICPLCIPGTDDKVTANLAVAQTAAIGKRAVTVVNEADGGSATLADAFTVNPGPKVTSASNAQGQSVLCRPATGNGCANPQALTVLGSDFPSPATEDDKAAAFKILNADGSEATGITVANRVFTAGKITADVTVDATRTLGPLRIAIYNAADKGFGTCDTCLAVATPPTAVTGLKLVAGPGSLKATWNAPVGSFGAPVTGYRLELKRAGTTTTSIVSTSAREYTFTKLANGSTYTVAVQAVNAAGLSPKVTATGIPGLLATLTAKQSAKVVTYGSRVIYSGKLSRTGTTIGIPKRGIRLTFVPAIGKAFSQTVTTSSTGTWAFAYTPRVPTATLTKVSQYSVKVYPLFLGDYAYRKAAGPTQVTGVAPRVKISSPLSGSRSSASTTIKVTGSILPSKAGRTVYLYRFTSSGRTLLARTTVSSSSTFAFSIRPSRGTYTLRAYIPSTPGNVAAFSPSIVIYRV